MKKEEVYVILVIDDDRMHQFLMGRIFCKISSYKLLFSYKPEDIWTYLSLVNAIDLVIVEPFLKETNGFDLISKLRFKLKDTPILALTIGAMNDEKKMCLNSGCDYFLSKPFSIEQLRILVKQILKSERKKFGDKKQKSD